MEPTRRTLRMVQRALPLAAQAEERIRSQLLSDPIAVPQRLVEGDIARRFEMSRTPVREALHRLSLLGVIEPVSGGGYVARHFTIREVHEHYDLRVLLEAEAASLAAARVDARPAALGLLEPMSGEAAIANAEFHNGIGELSGNTVLARVIRTLNQRSVGLRLYARGSEIERRTLDEGHRAIVAAIGAGDAAAARDAMVSHLEVVRDAMLGIVGTRGAGAT